ncbi:mitochondrial aspartate-glutamate transporter agc1 [Tieghemiomyces parasiticus]|uniref:Mitochondrial aspartate-glutamate transporter agc1 n=1 Tax=Tieghemiomyces parasiticus TaxID=78921 RepID=A0A9W8AH15_9FUNG|nr:mitochondrial aspartate-glutamate transporter agc1 [Tieghemiomyces parasiticus]
MAQPSRTVADNLTPRHDPVAPKSVTKPSPGLTQLTNKLASGAVAGITGTLIIYPLDIVKTRLQNQRPNTQGVLPYRSGLACFRSIIQREGARGIYRGLVPTLVGITPEKAIKLAVNDYTREWFSRRRGVADGQLTAVEGMLSGATAGFCQVVVTNPMEIVKIHMQVAGAQAASSGTGPPPQRPTALGIVRQLGLRGLYRGTPATLLRDVPFSIFFFPSHAILKSLFVDPATGQAPFHAVFLSGVTAAFFASGAVTPADVIKTRLQVSPASGTPKYLGVRDCFKDIVRNEGIGALFKGVLPRCCIVAPLFGIALLTYEVQQRWLQSKSA